MASRQIIQVRELPPADWGRVVHVVVARLRELAPRLAKQSDGVSYALTCNEMMVLGQELGRDTLSPFPNDFWRENCVAWVGLTLTDAMDLALRVNWKSFKEAQQDLEHLLALRNVRLKVLVYTGRKKDEPRGTGVLLGSRIVRSPHVRGGDLVVVVGWINFREEFDVHVYLAEEVEEEVGD